MSDTANDKNDSEEEVQLLDPTDFGPETVDGQRPPGTETAPASSSEQPGDPELDADPEDEPSS